MSNGAQNRNRRFRYSDFGIPSDFVIRHADFGIAVHGKPPFAFCACIGTMNLIDPPVFATSRSVTVGNMTRPNFGLLVGEIGSGQRQVHRLVIPLAEFPLERLVLLESWLGTAVRAFNS